MTLPSLTLAAKAIDVLARPIALVRIGPGAYVEGQFQPGARVRTTIQAAHQPITAEDLLQLAEGDRTEAMKSLWSRAELRSANEAAQTPADELEIEGAIWRVIKVWPRSEAGFWKAVAGRADDRSRSL